MDDYWVSLTFTQLYSGDGSLDEPVYLLEDLTEDAKTKTLGAAGPCASTLAHFEAVHPHWHECCVQYRLPVDRRTPSRTGTGGRMPVHKLQYRASPLSGSRRLSASQRYFGAQLQLVIAL